jgi:long-chain acyl-CoA synthetase
MATKQSSVPPDAARTLAIASRVVEKSLGDMIPDPMTLPQLRILSLVARAPERASRLASQSDVSRPTLTGVLDGLVARGWVKRTEVEGDRRGVELEATSTGRAALEAAQRAVATKFDDVLALVEPAQRVAAIVGLEALSEALHAHMKNRALPAP